MKADSFGIGLLVGLALAVAFATVVDAKRRKAPPPPPTPPDVVYALDSAALRSYGEQVRTATGDSLAALFKAQAARARKRVAASPFASLVDTVRDTVPEVCLPEVDVRTVLIADTICPVRVDSFARQDTIHRYRIRLQQQELAKQRFQKRVLAGALAILLTVGTVLNFAE